MKRANILYSCILLSLISILCPISAFSQDNDTSTVKISKLKIKGAKAVSEKEIKEKIETESPSSIKFWAKRPEFSEEVLREDMVRIRRVYANHGYYDAEARYQLNYDNSSNRVEVTINIEEGDPVILKEFNIEGTLTEETKKKILDKIPLKVDEKFSEIMYQDTKAMISSVFLEMGYPKAKVKGEALVNRKEKWAKVNFQVDSDALYNFGSIRLEGNEIVKANIINREISFKEGELYSIKKIDETRSRIFRLDLFKSVLVDSEFDEERKIANMVIKVKEKKLGTIKVGVGYGTEDHLRGQIIATQRNFFGGGRRLELAGKFSFLTQKAEAIFTQPYIMGGGSELRASFNLQRDDFPSYTSDNIIGRIGVKKNFKNVYSALGSFSVQQTDLSEIAEATKPFILEDKYFLTYINAGLERNTTDNVLDPTRGTVATLGLETSFKVLQSDVNYIQGTVELKGYKQVFRNVVFASRILGGVIKPFGGDGSLDIPIFKRFLAGGSTSMRGFPFQKLGPLDDGENPIGGNTVLLGNFEMRFPIYQKLGGVVFFDYGNVYPKEFDFKFGEIKYAVGTGLRYNTLIGPLRADVGYALNPEPGIGRIQFFLSIGHVF